MDQILFLESETAAYHGEFARSRELTRHAADSAQRVGEKETAAEYLGHASVREALMGNMDSAEHDAKAAIALTNSRHGTAFSAIALAPAGESAQAARLSDDLRSNFTADTIVQYDYLPRIRAPTALRNGDAPRAVEALAAAEPTNWGMRILPSPSLSILFTCGAWLIWQRSRVFQRQVSFRRSGPRGVVGNQPIGAPARLGLARSYTQSGYTAKSKAA